VQGQTRRGYRARSGIRTSAQRDVGRLDRGGGPVTPEQATATVRVLFAHYVTFRPTMENIQAYANMLKRFDLTVANSAVQRLVLTHKRIRPTPAEIVEAWLLNLHGPRRVGAEAYAEVLLAVRQCGRCYGGEPAPAF